MKESVTIKDVCKERFVYLPLDKFSKQKAMIMVNQLLVWLIEKEITISDLPVVVMKEDRVEIGIPIKDAKLQETKEYKIDHLGAHRMGSIFHRDSDKPLDLSEKYLERQLKYQGYQLLEPRRYVLHPNPQTPEIPLIEIQIPIHK
jgi:hypothetical protein